MNILLITSIYPLPSDNKGTSVCHYFAREWVKTGHGVRVVHNEPRFPIPFYLIAKLFRQKIVAKTGAVVYTKRINDAKYEMEGVSVMRLSLFKPIPHGNFTKRAVNKAIKKIEHDLNKDNFTPDIIAGHFPNPQIEMVGRLKEIWPKAKTAIIMHGDVELAKKVYGNRLLTLSEKIDVWGFRNPTVLRVFEKCVMRVDKAFMCYSGIPEDYITTNNTHYFDSKTPKVVYVGEMIERKYPVEVMVALEKAYPNGNYILTYVGDGHLLNIIRERVASEAVKGHVNALGKIPRDGIKEQYDNADIMVMISKWEAYGLVYLEAMARGCITIASRNEGFDGIIVDGENGFLCKAGDAFELASIFNRIEALTVEERQRISENAIATAKTLTDVKAAKQYLDNLINL